VRESPGRISACGALLGSPQQAKRIARPDLLDVGLAETGLAEAAL
jgi:hypothetical protein